MVLADTSIWVDHFRRNSSRLGDLLIEGTVATHPLVIGELACGNLKNRKEILSLLHALPTAPRAEDDEILFFIEKHSLAGKGIGLNDVHLLASCCMGNLSLWTRDKRLGLAAQDLDVAFA